MNVISNFLIKWFFWFNISQSNGLCLRLELCTMSNLFSSDTNADTAKATRQHAARARYVLMTARCWSSPGARAELNDGQYNQRNTVPEIKGHGKFRYSKLKSYMPSLVVYVSVNHQDNEQMSPAMHCSQDFWFQDLWCQAYPLKVFEKIVEDFWWNLTLKIFSPPIIFDNFSPKIFEVLFKDLWWTKQSKMLSQNVLWWSCHV